MSFTSRFGLPLRRTIIRTVIAAIILYFVAIGLFSTGAGKVGDVKDAGKLAQTIATGSPVLIDFTAKWCMPCKMMAPELEKVAAANKNVHFLKADIDEHPELAQRYGVSVTTVPSVFFFNRAKQTGKFGGSRDAGFIQSFIDGSMQ